MNSNDSLVWYVSYGSNMSSSRFSCYINGGQPLNASRSYKGCRDSSPPVKSTTWVLPGSVVFGGTFYAWDPRGSGAALYVPSDYSASIARAWLISFQQFKDVIAQENGKEPGEFDNVLDPIFNEDLINSTIGNGPYNKIVYCGKYEGFPAFTFTTSLDFESIVLNAPSEAYLNCLAVGLAETLGLSFGNAKNYLSSYPGAKTPRAV